MTAAERARRRWLAALVPAVVLLATVAVLVHGRTSGSSIDPPPPAPLRQGWRVDWDGCADVWLRNDAPLCMLGREPELRLWVEGPPAVPLEILVDGVVTAAERYTVEGEAGEGFRVRVPTGAAELVVRAVGATPADARWSLSLGAASDEAPSEALLRARKEIPAALQARDAKRARRAAEQAHAAALEQGRLQLAVDMVLSTAVNMTRRRLDPESVDGLFRFVEDAALRYPKGRGDLAYNRGLHHWYTGAIQDAGESLREAVRWARRLEARQLAAESIPMYAEALAQLGYDEDALRWAREGESIVRALGNHCTLGSVLRTVGWVSLGLRRRGRSHDDPVPLLEGALEAFGERGKCYRPGKLGGARLSLALLAFDQGRLADAAAQLGWIDRSRITIDERLQVDDLEMRLSLARAPIPDVRWVVYRRLRASVEAVDTADARWRLHTRRGRLLEQEGDDAGAIAAYRAAELELDALVRLQAVGIGRGELAERYHESTEALVSLLVGRGDVEQAWCIVRQDQARRRATAVAPTTLGTAKAEIDETIRRYRSDKLAAEILEAKAQDMPRDEAQSVLKNAAEARDHARVLANELAKTLGRLAPHPRCTDLPPPGPSELLLGLYPREHDWLLFASDALGTTVHVVSAPSLDDGPEAVARALLQPVGSRIDAAGRLRVLAHRQAQGIDVHRLPWAGVPLGVWMPVSYGVELPVRPEPRELEYRALLVVDPTNTLEGAEAEAELVDERLIAAGWFTEVSNPLEPGVVSLAGYDLFHYAGHAEASERPEQGGWPPYPGGEAGWAAFLELGRAGQLTVHDVTTMGSVPQAAVLAGCRTGTLELDTGQTSLALAFLVAGSEQVVASANAVEDTHGLRFARGFYEALVHEPGVDLVVAMQAAQRGLWEAGEELAGYRVWVR